MATLVRFLLGIVVSVLLAYLIYRGAVRLDLRRLFSITGVLLIFVAAGCRLRRARPAGGRHPARADLRGRARGQRAVCITVLAWMLYVTVVLTLFLRPGSRCGARRRPEPQETGS
jgi:high-affinity iron transporter